MVWQAVALDVRVADLARRHVAVRGLGPDGKPTVVLITLSALVRGGVVARMFDMAVREPLPQLQRVTCPGSASLGAAVLAHTAVRGTSAAEPPRIRWPISGFRMSLPVTLLLLATTLIATLLTSQPVLLVLAVPMVINLWTQFRGTHLVLHPSVTDDSVRLLPSQIMARIPEQAITAGPSPLDRVDLVKLAYGRLMSDIVYRIENSALFDAAHPPTSRFQVALTSWDAGSSHTARLAEEVEVSFAEARRDAERLGLAHLPLTARPSAARAVKAVRLALSDAPEPERAAAIARADDLLSSLALYYLPAIDRRSPSLIGSRRAIEPSS